MPSRVQTIVDLARIRTNALQIARQTGVELIGVVKADAYGHGAVAVADAIADLVTGWYVFQPQEAVHARLFDLTGKPTIAAMTPAETDVEMLRSNGVRPGVWTLEQLDRFADLDPLLSVDTGMQRFACPPERIGPMFERYRFREAFTHASRPEQAQRLSELMAGRDVKLHAGASALLDDPRCRLDAVRPGFALYAGAARVTARIVEAHDSVGPVGYTGFSSTRHGVIVAGYSNGLRKGPCLVNGRRQQIAEVGMQSAYVTLDAADRAGDEVVLLGDDLTPAEVAKAWGASPHEAMLRLTSLGERSYRS